MNSWGSLLIWGVLQITLFTVIGAAVYLLARRRGPAAGSLVATAALALVMGVSLPPGHVGGARGRARRCRLFRTRRPP